MSAPVPPAVLDMHCRLSDMLCNMHIRVQHRGGQRPASIRKALPADAVRGAGDTGVGRNQVAENYLHKEAARRTHMVVAEIGARCMNNIYMKKPAQSPHKWRE